MKKKFLALALAAAVMAPTTSAFAQTTITKDEGKNTQTVGGSSDYSHSADVEINGEVRKADGSAAAGKIEVELPLTTTFTVHKDGRFQGSNFDIINHGGEEVNVAVESFTEGDSKGGIIIDSEMDESSNSEKDRNTVRLYLQHTIEGATNGFNLNSEVANQNVGNIKPSNRASFSLMGIAGIRTNNSDAETNGVRENFTLRFKIKKV